MTHDPREALEPCPFCGGKAEITRMGDASRSTIYNCAECGCRLETGEEFSNGRRWNTRALTASPGEQKSVDAGGGVRVKPLEWHDNRHAQSILGVYSINSWSSGAFSILRPNKGYPDNNSFPTVDAAKAAAQADYEQRILSALSTTPAAAESNYYAIQAALSSHIASSTELMSAMSSIWPLIKSPVAAESKASVEARLREALMDVCSLFDDEGNFREEHQDHASTALEKAERAVALSTVGVKSEGSPANPDQGLASQHEYPDESRSGRNSSRNQSASSDPTAERREIVARIIDENRELIALHVADKILAALDGGAGE